MIDARYAAIILAAGFSSRMHSFKPLLPLGDRVIADHLIRTFSDNGVEVILIVGHRQEELTAGIKSAGVRIIVNPRYRHGMFTSVQAGLRAVGSTCEAVFIAPVDIPLVRPYTIRRLLKAAAENPGKVIYPTFQNHRGHPPLLPSRIFRHIRESPEENNLKAVLQDYENTAVEVPVPDSYIHFDIDSPSDYRVLQECWKRYEVPTADECESIIHDICRLEPTVYNHSRKVSFVADAVSKALVESGIDLDIEAVRAASILHDIAKGLPDHEAAGARLLRDMGFRKVAEMVEMHTCLAGNGRTVDLETKIVFLADKLVMETVVVPLERRFQAALEKYGGDPQARQNIIERRDQALAVRKEIEALIGRSLETVITGED